jgi:hypothetical protein
MKKKNSILTLILIIMSVVLVLSGCKKKEDPVESPNPESPVEEPVGEVNEDEKAAIMDDFDVLIKDKPEPEKIVDYVNQNIKKVDQLEGDRMIDELEKSLEANIENLTNTIFATDKNNELMEIAGLEAYFPEEKIEEIKNSDLKEEITKTYDNMYKLVNLEGEFYPIIDYAKLKTYNNNITDEWKEYIAVRAMDSDEIPFADGSMRISFEELANRLLKTENFLNKYVAGPRQDEMTGLYEIKLNAYLKGLPNTPIADSSSKTISEEVMKSYESTSNMEGYITAHLTYQYIETIKANNSKIDNAVLEKADELITEAVRMLVEYK